MSKTWPLVKLGEVLEKSQNWVNLDAQEEYKEVTVRLWGKGVTLRGMVTGSQIAGSRRLQVHSNQFILSRIDARNGAFGLIPDELDNAVVSNDFPVFDIHQNRLLPKYLHWLSKTKNFVESCKSVSEGTTNRVRLKEDKFIQIEIALPPLAEQQRIVAKIERLARKIEEARELKNRSHIDISLLMPSILGGIYEESISAADKVKRLESICNHITDGTHHTPTYVPSGIPFLSVKDITSGQIKFDNTKFITIEEHNQLIKRCKPEYEDVLLTKVGTTGFAKAIDVKQEFSIFVSLALLKVKKDIILPSFLEHMLNSSHIQEQSKAGTRGVGNKNLVLKFIKEFPIPVPPLEKQRQLIEKISRLKQQVSHLKHIQAQTTAELDAMLPSILDKAFKGEL